VFGIPLALFGVVYYASVFLSALYFYTTAKRSALYIVIVFTPLGFFASLYFVYLQLVVIGAICFYCMISALTSTLLFLITQLVYPKERKYVFAVLMMFFYKNFVKRIFFMIDPELVHIRMTFIGNLLGAFSPASMVTSYALAYTNPTLTHRIYGMTFERPIGLAAGFDYEADLPLILPSLGFGFGSVGTITNKSYEGNPRPMLGRLPKSQSLMVNKGFKNMGADETIKKLTGQTFSIPIGVSIGRTNTKQSLTQKQSIADIIEGFTKFDKSNVKHAYYELNISCPNLYGDVSFYPPNNLKELLTEVEKLKLSRPIFIKMPIEKSDKETLTMLEVITKFKIAGVIIGNLQKNRKDPALHLDEVAKFKVGNFSGKPTFNRSNELISLAYKQYGKKLTIIGCGGVFNARDAYKKIILGASLVQLITGMIYEGPTLISRINYELADLLKNDGFTHISQAVGSRNK
jgi:dihydroorotate dehydrogenase subfamily 2